jgi:predicted S18 family serine protease
LSYLFLQGGRSQSRPSGHHVQQEIYLSGYTEINDSIGVVTPRGRVLPIGGLKEKILAASRGNICTILIPKDNEKDLVDIPKEILNIVTIHLVGHMDEVLSYSLLVKPEYPETSAFTETPQN